MTVKNSGNQIKGMNCNKMRRIENDQIISDKKSIADTMNKQFVNITAKSKLKPTATEPNKLILNRYKGRQNIAKIRSQMNDEKKLFSFKTVPKTLYSLKSKRSLSYTIIVKYSRCLAGSFYHV